MNESAQATLASIEALLTLDAVSARLALEAAYRLGKLDGQIEMARLAELRTLPLTGAPS